jgi:tryptophan synthase alpha chain
MAHVVAFFPDREASLEAAEALADGGCAYLEVQFPFSDPVADGPLIQTACARALKAGFTLEAGFGLVEKIADRCRIPVFVMCYANTVFHGGVPSFVARSAGAGVYGLIVPDLPPDLDEGLYAAASASGIHAVPVLAPTMTPGRLGMVLDLSTDYVYATLRTGITGSPTEIGDENIGFLDRIRRRDGGRPRILGGFGISRREQVEALAHHVHACVVGSAFVRILLQGGPGGIGAKMRELL